MEALFISGITQLCFLLNSLRILSYLPQIITIVKGKDDSKSISVLTWSFWTFTNFVTVLYTTFVHFDYILILTNDEKLVKEKSKLKKETAWKNIYKFGYPILGIVIGVLLIK